MSVCTAVRRMKGWMYVNNHRVAVRRTRRGKILVSGNATNIEVARAMMLLLAPNLTPLPQPVIDPQAFGVMTFPMCPMMEDALLPTVRRPEDRET